MSTAKYPGKALIAFLVLGNIGLWVAFPPADDGTRPDFFRQYLGEMIGATMMLLMAVALLLSTRLRFLEPLFGGLDKVYAAHRNIGIIAGLPLPLHFLVVPLAEEIPPGRAPGYIAFGGLLALILLSLAPRLPVVRKLIRIPYRGWRISHRFIGIFFIMGTAHMLLVDALVRTTVVPFAVLMAAIATGIASYVYTEFIAKFLRRKAVYQVREVNRLTPTAVEIVLQPVKKPLKFTAGQFAFVRFKGNRVLSEPHPFTISSSPKENNLRLTIRASGDYTQYLYHHLKTGVIAIVEGGYGMMDYRKGGKEQIWIAGGIGVTPFLSWIRDMPQDLAHSIDFFYTVRTKDEALFLSEIREAAQRHRHFRVYVIYSAERGRLTVEDIARTVPGNIAGKHIYMCGPSAMLASFRNGFRRIGVPAHAIHYEEFSFR